MFRKILCSCTNGYSKISWSRQQFANRHYWKNMECVDLQPPKSVRGMTALNRNAFHKQIKVPTLQVPENLLNRLRPLVKSLLLKMENLKPVRSVPRNGGNADKQILLHPRAINGWASLPKDLAGIGVLETNFHYADLELGYENWKADEILKSVLPEDGEGVTSFSRIGHVVHINLRDHLEPYKKLIGEVLLDKVVGCRAVVNKTKNIENVYRNFELELICGEPDYLVEVKEHGVTFQFDFATVYWNPRLSTEHDRIVNLLKPSDVLYDVFAGVGPFSIPAAAKKKCTVIANDLNPESFKWLNVNVKKNKCQDRIKTFNLDGRDFIRDVVSKDLIERWSQNSDKQYEIHVTMNLPALAVEFLNEFDGLLADERLTEFPSIILPIVHVYTFAKGVDDKEKLVLDAVESHLQHSLNDNLMGVHFVRNVAPNKDMYRVSFRLTKEVLFNHARKRAAGLESDETNSKKICL